MFFPMSTAKRRYPIGAELVGENQTHFRVWAPKARELDVVAEHGPNSQRTFHSLSPEQGGYFSGALDVGVGTRYWFRVNSGERFYPDPASRFQPEGPHGSSCIVDPRQFHWTDSQWPGPAAAGLKGQIIYEMHIGTFTKDGTWRAATEQLAELARIGITVVEMMPIADFPGKFGWGYDGVNLFAPSHLYGIPDDLRSFIDRAHSLGVAVILDVVYNHFGPDGNYLGIFSDDYLIREKENEQEAKMARPRSEGGDDLDGMWNDDFHHSAVVALTGRNEAYFNDYSGTPQEFISAAKHGFLYQGQALSWRKALRGTSTVGIAPEVFVCFSENHDQIANTGQGERLRFQTSPGRYRAMAAVLLLGPWTPLLFQGQEFGASSPFIFFADIGDASVRDAIRKGRAKWLASFLSLTEQQAWQTLPAPDDPDVFARCKLDFSERERNRELYDLHIDLLKLRREDSRFRQQSSGGIDGAVLGRASFVFRYFAEANDDRLLLVNFGESHSLHPASEPLLAPPIGCKWKTLWTSDSPRYGGAGSIVGATQDRWILPAESAFALRLERKA